MFIKEKCTIQQLFLKGSKFLLQITFSGKVLYEKYKEVFNLFWNNYYYVTNYSNLLPYMDFAYKR